MHDRVTLYIAREAARVFDPHRADTVEVERPVLRLNAEHALSEQFSIEAVFDHDDPNLEVESWLWKEAAVELVDEAVDGEAVAYHGVIETAEYLDTSDTRSLYRVVLRPSVHRLAYRQDSRIFQAQSVVDIVRELVAHTGQTLEFRLASHYDPREYTVQHQESDLDFAERLLEEEGIFYWYEHSLTQHVMCLADDAKAHQPVNDLAVFRAQLGGVLGSDGISDLRFSTHMVPDSYLARDWNWLTPNAPIEGAHESGPSRRFEVCEYPAGAQDAARARRLAERRLEAHSVPKYRLDGRANTLRICPGRTFTLVDAKPPELNLDYLVTRVAHDFQPDKANRILFTAIPSTLSFRPQRKKSRPRVGGRESAIVTGPSDEEIHVDAFGQVKTQFYWDRVGQLDEHTSRWIRTIQPNTVGSMYLPRLGWEVAIGYENGDPDRPIVTHQQFNTERMPAYPLPDSLPKTSWQSRTSPGGAGSNELRFDDTNLEMELFLHAQRDLDTRVGNDRREMVGVNSTQAVFGRLSTSIAGDETVTVGIDQVTRVHGEWVSATGGDKRVAVAGMDSRKVDANYTLTTVGDRGDTIAGPSVSVAGTIAHAVHGNRSRSVGGAQAFLAGSAFLEVVGQDKVEAVQGARVALVAGAHVEEIGQTKSLEAGQGTFHSRGTYSLDGRDTVLQAGGSVRLAVAEAYGHSASEVVLRGENEVRARAGGAELKIGGDVLDVNASHFSGSGTLVRLIGQVEMIGAGSAEQPEPPQPGPEDNWLELVLVDADGKPMSGREYLVRLPDGSERSGRLGADGRARLDGIPPGSAVVSFPGLGQDTASRE